MAKEKIVIAELDIDVKSLTKAMEESKSSIKSLTSELNQYKEKGKESSAEHSRIESELKKVTEAYETQKAAIDTQTQLTQALTDEQENLNISQQDVNTSVKETSAALQSSGKTFSDYKQQVIDSLESINILNGGFAGFISRVQEAGGVFPLLKGVFSGITTGIAGMGKAIMANPLGAILGLILMGVQALSGVFKNFMPIMNKVEQIMAGVGAVIDSIKNSIIGLLTGSIGIIDFFSGFASAASNAADEAMNLKKAQQELAREMELQEVRNKKAQVLIEKQMELVKDETLCQEGRIAAYKKAADIETKNMQQRKKNADDEYKIAIEKIALSANLTESEIKDFKKQGFAYAQKLQLTKQLDAEEVKNIIKLQNTREDAFEESRKLINSQNKYLEDMHKQFAADQAAEDKKKKDEALQRQRDHEQKKQQLIQTALQSQKLDLDLFIQQQGSKAKSLKDELAFIETLTQKKIALAKAEYDASAKTANDKKTFDLAKNQAEMQQLKDRASAAVDHANAEYNLYVQTNKSKLDSAEELTQKIINEEEARLNRIKELKLKILAQETNTNQQIIDEKIAANIQLTLVDKEYLTKKASIEEEHNSQIKTNKQQLEEQEKTRKLSQQQEDKDIALAQATTEQEQKLLEEGYRHSDEVERLKSLLEEKKITEIQYNQALEIENKKTEKNKEDINKAALDNKLSLAQTGFSNMAAILGKESAAGKAMAVAQATIDTYKAATAAYASMSGIPVVGPALGAIAAGAAVAAGIANVKKITATKEVKPPKAEKGALFNIGGNRHSAGGTMFTGADGTQFEAEKGELIGVMNRNAARHFMAFNNAFPAGGGGASSNYFESGGIVSREIAPAGMDIDSLASKIAEANRAIPAPVVAVHDIISEGNSYVKVREAANF